MPDIALPDVGSAADTGSAAAEGTARGDAGAAAPMEDPRSPIAVNLLEFVPEMLDGVKARRRQLIKTAPIVHGFYQSDDRRVYNLHITGPTETDSERRGRYPVLGKDEKKKSGPLEHQGFMLGEFEGQRTYDAKGKKSTSVVLVNRFVEVKLSVAPTDKPDESTKLLEQVDLQGVSRLQ